MAELTKHHPFMRRLVIHAIVGEERTHLMPCCFDFVHARNWQSRAACSKRKNTGVIVRIPVAAIGENNIIDVSSRLAQKVFFDYTFEKWGSYVRNNNFLLRRSITNGELLIMWRGSISVRDMVVVSEDTGEPVLPYADLLAALYVKKQCWIPRAQGSYNIKTLVENHFGSREAIEEHALKMKEASDEVEEEHRSDAEVQEEPQSGAPPEQRPKEMALKRNRSSSRDPPAEVVARFPMPSRRCPGDPMSSPRPPPVIPAAAALNRLPDDRLLLVPEYRPMPAHLRATLRASADPPPILHDNGEVRSQGEHGDVQAENRDTSQRTAARVPAPGQPENGAQLSCNIAAARIPVSGQGWTAGAGAPWWRAEDGAQPSCNIDSSQRAQLSDFDERIGPVPVSVFHESEADWGGETEEDEEETEDNVQIMHVVVAAYIVRRNHMITATMNATQSFMYAEVQDLEKQYLKRRAKITEQALYESALDKRCRSSNPAATNPYIRGQGRCDESQSARLQHAQDIFDYLNFGEKSPAVKQLDAEHRKSLLDLCDGGIPDWLPLAPFSKKVVKTDIGAQPSQYPEHAAYADILWNLGLIESNRGPGKRTCGKLTKEKPIPDGNYPRGYWAKWWMQIGGFDNPAQTDARGMTPLHHAADHCGVFKRAAKAFEELLEVSTLETINQFISTDEPNYPNGYLTTHLLASGVDVRGRKPRLMRRLLDARADVNATTLWPPHNTAATMIGGQGGGEMLKLLIEMDADANATTSRGLGILQAGRSCSTSVANIARSVNCSDTHSASRRRERNLGDSMSHSRAIRQAQKLSYNAAGPDDGQQWSQRQWSLQGSQWPQSSTWESSWTDSRSSTWESSWSR